MLEITAESEGMYQAGPRTETDSGQIFLTSEEYHAMPTRTSYLGISV